MRKRWLPDLMDRRPYNIWEERKDGARQWALQNAQTILRQHQPDPLDEALQFELMKIIHTEEKSI
jgi:trimethylamine:corrinoid methyltransferase-like protein